ncbi:MAG TPA: hypothetical protein VNX65_05210 [Patescibacteria group bacterium]|jgi:uncharacterized protein YrrD|nr:hypothetical protein [Patescibacteria group bacterium]
MLVLSNHLIGIPIMGLHTGTELGKTVRPIIDPAQLHIQAFYCEGPLIDFKPAILHTGDVRELSTIGIIVDSSDNIMPPDDLVRLQPLLDLNFKLDDKLVVEESGHKLGRVVNYIVESDTFYILKLHIKPGLIQSMMVTELIIDRSQIINITDDKIVVKQAAVQDKVARALPHHAIQNPFRHPQTEASHTNTSHAED